MAWAGGRGGKRKVRSKGGGGGRKDAERVWEGGEMLTAFCSKILELFANPRQSQSMSELQHVSTEQLVTLLLFFILLHSAMLNVPCPRAIS